jgi:hypothetical protein
VESSSTSKMQNLNARTAARFGALTGCSRRAGPAGGDVCHLVI